MAVGLEGAPNATLGSGVEVLPNPLLVGGGVDRQKRMVRRRDRCKGEMHICSAKDFKPLVNFQIMRCLAFRVNSFSLFEKHQPLPLPSVCLYLPRAAFNFQMGSPIFRRDS